MANDGKLTIEAFLDTSEVEKKIKELQTKLEGMRRKSGLEGPIGQMTGGQTGSGQDQNSMRIRRLETVRRRENDRERKLIIRDLQKQYSELDKQVDQYEKLVKLQKELKKEGKDITQNVKDQAAKFKEISETSAKINLLKAASSQSPIDRLKTAYQYGGFQGAAKAAGRLGMGTMAGLAGSGLLAGAGAIGGAMQSYGDFQYFRAGLPIRQTGRELGIAQGTTQLRGRAMRGQNYEDLIFAPERARSIDKTMDVFENLDSARQTRATGKAIVRGAGTVAAGVAGAKFGAGLGSSLGPLGTLIGGGIGGLAGAGLAGMGLFQDEEAYYGLTGQGSELSKMSGQKAMQYYETEKLRRRMEDPTKYYQKKFLSENRDRLLRAQRSGGLSEEDLYGGLGYMRQGSSEFLMNDRFNMSNQIVGAGGSGAGAYGGLQVLALQAQRSMGLTNAGQGLGRLSNYMNQEETEEAFIRILSKGVTIGLDNSEMKEQQKDYLAQVTAMAQRVGTGEDMFASAMIAGMGKDPSRRDVAMAGSGVESLMGAMNNRGGVTAAARAGLIDEEFGQYFGGFDRIKFQNMKMEDINEQSNQMRRFYEKAKKRGYKGTFEEFVNKRQEIQRKSLFNALSNTEMFGDKSFDEIFKAGNERDLTDDEVADLVGAMDLLPEFAGKGEKQLEAIVRSYFGMERVEEGDKKKRQEEQRIKQKQYEKRVKEGKAIPFAGANKETGPNVFAPMSEEEFQGMFKTPVPEEVGPQTTEDKIRGGAMSEIDKQIAAMAKQQSKQFENMASNMSEVFANSIKNLDQTLAAQVQFEEFNKALNSGAGAVQDFLDALKGVRKQNKGKSAQQQQQEAMNVQPMA